MVQIYLCIFSTWMVTKSKKLYDFINRCLRNIFRIYWPNRISNGELLHMKWKKFVSGCLDKNGGGHTLYNDQQYIEKFHCIRIQYMRIKVLWKDTELLREVQWRRKLPKLILSTSSEHDGEQLLLEPYVCQRNEGHK